MIERLKNETDFERERVSFDNKEFAAGMANRILAYVDRWQESTYTYKGNIKSNLARAMQKNAWMLEAIAGKIIRVPRNNIGEPAIKPDGYLLILRNGIGWQNFNKIFSEESLFESMRNRFRTIKRGVRAYPERLVLTDYEQAIYGDESDNIAEEIAGFLNHAMQMRVAIESQASGETKNHLIVTPLAAKALKGVQSHNDDREYNQEDENYWQCSQNVYLNGRPDQEFDKGTQGLTKMVKNMMKACYDLPITIKIDGKYELEINHKDLKIHANVADIVNNDNAQVSGSTRISYYHDQVAFSGIPMTEAVKQSISGPLDRIIDHWITRGLGTQVIKFRKQPVWAVSILETKEAPGQIIFLPWFNAENHIDPDNLRDPRKLKIIKTS